MKLNWGTGIAIFYSLFVIVLVAFVFKSMTYDNSLVVEDYYQKDIDYQQHYDKVKNASQLKTDLTIDIDRNNKSIRFQFPSEFQSVSGDIQFYKPDNKKLDFNIPVETDSNNVLQYDFSKLAQGIWKIKVEWQSQAKSYYKEKRIHL
jgi:hypothetical protein